MASSEGVAPTAGFAARHGICVIPLSRAYLRVRPVHLHGDSVELPVRFHAGNLEREQIVRGRFLEDLTDAVFRVVPVQNCPPASPVGDRLQ